MIFALTIEEREPERPRHVIHMEARWDDHGPIGACGKRPPKLREDEPHRQTMTTEASEATCGSCRRVLDRR